MIAFINCQVHNTPFLPIKGISTKIPPIIDENKLNYFILKLFDYNIEEEVENSIMDILEAMKQRHSVRSYQNKPLEDTLADQLEHFIVHLQFTVEKNWLL